MSKFIQLNRTFIDFDPAASSEAESYSIALGKYSWNRKTWSDLLQKRCVVIHAEARMGKTTELEEKTRDLRKEEKNAFFCRLEMLAGNPLEKCLAIGSEQELQAWMKGTAHGYFFLDSVDEARLIYSKDFENALIKFHDTIKSHIERTTIIISTRPNAWQAQADPAMLKRILNLGEPTFELMTEETGFNNLIDILDTAVVSREMPKKDDSFAIVQMTPLDKAQIRTFASAKGIEDIDNFMDAIDHAEADLFASRPDDLGALIQDWENSRSLGCFSEVVIKNVKRNLSEENPTHGRISPIAPDRALQGASALAAAITLVKRTSFRLPDQPVDQDLVKEAIDPQEILSSWTPSEIQALLGRAIFDEGLYGTVRFYERTAREYLAARWFEKLLLKRKQRRKIEALFFRRPYGTEPEVVVPSLKPIMGWLANWDQDFRRRLLRIDPKVLLEFGDASTLDVGTRASLLKDYAKRYEHRDHTPLRLDPRKVRRLADQDLGIPIRDLLGKYRHHTDVTQLLLRIIREGKIGGCSSIAKIIAEDTSTPVYTRALALQVVGLTGTPKEKNKTAGTIKSSAVTLDRSMISAALEAFWPDVYSDQEFLTLLESAPGLPEFTSDSFEAVVPHLIIDRLDDNTRRHWFLENILTLLRRPPLNSDGSLSISLHFDWLLPVLWKVAKTWQALEKYPENDPVFLSALSICCQAEDFHRQYIGEMNKEVSQLLDENISIRHALFWHECQQARLSTQMPVTEWWSSRRIRRLVRFEDADCEAFLQDLHAGTNPDDKLVALSVLTTALNKRESNQGLLEKTKQAIQGNSILEEALDKVLSPLPFSPQEEEWEVRLAKLDKECEEKKRKTEQSREERIAYLKEHPDKVGDLNIASEGKVLKNTAWLIEEMGRQPKKNPEVWTKWTQSNWKTLEPDFGKEVATHFRNFCQEFWRRYTPQLRSERVEENRTIPWGVIVGLCGLSIEAQENSQWSQALTPEQAKLATRYALWEINKFPPWLCPLYKDHSFAVKQILLQEITWEFDSPGSPEISTYVLSRLRGATAPLAHDIRNELIEILNSRPMANLTPLKEALTVILRVRSPLPQGFADMVAEHFQSATAEPAKAIWLATLLCVDAPRAINLIENWVKSGKGQTGKENRITQIINHVWGEPYDCFNSHHQEFQKVDVLQRLLILIHSYIRIEDDNQHSGVYTPNARDFAQQTRGFLLKLLGNIPGKQTFLALGQLAKIVTHEYLKNHICNLADERAEADVESEAWQPKGIAAFALETEISPKDQRTLFDLALSRIDDIKLDLEEGDESEASLWRKVQNEPELRRIIANRLKHNSQNKYTTGSEEELADTTRTDIRLHYPDVEARIPIEIKIAGKWTAKQHRERLRNQLIGQYMHESKYGLFLVVNCARKKDRKSWAIRNKKRCDFVKLVQYLKSEACRLLEKRDGIQGLEVIGIDLLIRNQSSFVSQTRHTIKRKKK